MHTRQILLCLAACGFGGLWFGNVDASSGGLVVAAEVADLKDQLEKGLKARRPEEFAFLAKVVQMVESDKLPRELVQSSFLYVRKTRKYEKYLVPYFERVLKIQADKAGIPL